MGRAAFDDRAPGDSPMRNRFPLTLPDSAADPRTTDLSRPLMPPRHEADLDQWQNRNRTTTIPYQLVANASTRALPYNPRRSGLMIQNLDPSANLRYSFGNDLQGSGLIATPNGGTALFDFTTPPDELYLFATANISVIVMEITRIVATPKLRR
jgi:hypothetical protein